jgi:membrane-associated PAP2 superfamily phosphatase
MKRNVVLVSLFVLLGGVALADSAVSPVAAITAVTCPLWKTILMGAIGGAVAAIYGWLKNRDAKTGQEAFGWQYAVCTVVVGALLGAVAGWKGLPDAASAMDWIQGSAIGSIAIPGVEMLLKLIFRQAPPTLSSIISVLKGTPPPQK